MMTLMMMVPTMTMFPDKNTGYIGLSTSKQNTSIPGTNNFSWKRKNMTMMMNATVFVEENDDERKKNVGLIGNGTTIATCCIDKKRKQLPQQYHGFSSSLESTLPEWYNSSSNNNNNNKNMACCYNSDSVANKINEFIGFNKIEQQQLSMRMAVPTSQDSSKKQRLIISPDVALWSATTTGVRGLRSMDQNRGHCLNNHDFISDSPLRQLLDDKDWEIIQQQGSQQSVLFNMTNDDNADAVNVVAVSKGSSFNNKHKMTSCRSTVEETMAQQQQPRQESPYDEKQSSTDVERKVEVDDNNDMLVFDRLVEFVNQRDQETKQKQLQQQYYYEAMMNQYDISNHLCTNATTTITTIVDRPLPTVICCYSTAFQYYHSMKQRATPYGGSGGITATDDDDDDAWVSDLSDDDNDDNDFDSDEQDDDRNF